MLKQSVRFCKPKFDWLFLFVRCLLFLRSKTSCVWDVYTFYFYIKGSMVYIRCIKQTFRIESIVLMY